MDKEKQIREILRRLKKIYPVIRTALHFKAPFELLVATILSAQNTDAGVNKVTENLFKKYRTVKDYAEVPLEELRNDIRTINFYRGKAASIKKTAQIILDQFGGKVPKSMAELVALPGIARKTANVILSGAYGINEGIAVDTHVKRLANRLGLTEHDDPVKIERDLMAVTPREEWANLSHLLIFHGRNICVAKKPKHHECMLYDLCPSRDI